MARSVLHPWSNFPLQGRINGVSDCRRKLIDDPLNFVNKGSSDESFELVRGAGHGPEDVADDVIAALFCFFDDVAMDADDF